MKIPLTALTLTLLLALAVSATPQDAQSTAGHSGQFTGSTIPNTITAQGGNVTENRPVYADASTVKWQGFWGNISGNLRLGDGTSVFYDWSSVTFQAVFASPGNTVDWVSVVAINDSTQRAAKDTEYGFNPSDYDSINRTMSGNACNAGTVISGASAARPNDGTGFAGPWHTCIGDDGSGLSGTVLGTAISAGQAFNGEAVDYQLMIPVAAGTQNYYFYLEV